MRAALFLTLGAAVGTAVLVWSWNAFGPDSVVFCFLVVWVPMTALGTVSHWVRILLPERCHRLRPWEATGRCYELLGVRVAKQLLRRGPLAAFNPHLHLPSSRDPAAIAALDGRMREAEASHLVLLLLTVPVALALGVAEGVQFALWTLAFDVLLNGYPMMLQRYNRALLARRYGHPPTGG